MMVVEKIGESSHRLSADSSDYKTTFTVALIDTWFSQVLSLLGILIYKLSSAILILSIWLPF